MGLHVSFWRQEFGGCCQIIWKLCARLIQIVFHNLTDDRTE